MRPSDLIEKVVTASYLQILFQKVCSKLRLFDSILFLIKENLLQQNPMECRNKSSCWMEGFWILWVLWLDTVQWIIWPVTNISQLASQIQIKRKIHNPMATVKRSSTLFVILTDVTVNVGEIYEKIRCVGFVTIWCKNPSARSAFNLLNNVRQICTPPVSQAAQSVSWWWPNGPQWQWRTIWSHNKDHHIASFSASALEHDDLFSSPRERGLLGTLLVLRLHDFRMHLRERLSNVDKAPRLSIRIVIWILRQCYLVKCV